ncbi:unnamed protein product, partial [Rhizoctonia solani]
PTATTTLRTALFYTRSNMWGPVQKVAKISELLILIARDLDIEGQCKLMLVSKQFFYSVGPLVWERVPRLDFLLKVITGTEVNLSHPQDSQRPYRKFTEIAITLPLNPNLARYNIYAPWVQELEIFAECSQDIYYAHRFLNLLCGPALPNLRRLTAHTGANNMCTKLLINFIDMFMSPSLTEVRTIFHKRDCATYTHPLCVPGFLKKVQTTCPQIQVLEFYPGTYRTWTIEHFTLSDQCLDTIRSFSSLCSLTSTTCLLNSKALSILGDLPHLESLGIRSLDLDYPIMDEPLFITENQFERLTDLRLYSIHHQDIKILWNQPPIARKIRSAVVQTDPSTAPDPFDGLADGNSWITSFLMPLPIRCPRLRHLILRMGDEDAPKFRTSQEVQNILYEPSLKNIKIELRNTCDADDSEDSEDEGSNGEDWSYNWNV